MLFAVIVSSILISIGLSIFNISIKELTIATTAKDSVQAYYAADSARECAVFWDIVQGAFPACVSEFNGSCTQVSTGTSITINCADNQINMEFIESPDSFVFSYTSPVNMPFFKYAGWPSAPDAGIYIRKIFVQGDPTVIETRIETGGHSTGIIGRRVERGMRFDYAF